MFLTNVFTKMAIAINNVAVLANLDYLKTDGNGAFDQLETVIKGYFADAYQLLIVIGVAVLVLAGVCAGILFGVLKDSQKVKENKTWIMRVLGAVAIVAGILTGVSIFFGIGEAMGNSIDTDKKTENATPTPTPAQTSDAEMELPYGAVVRF